MEIKATADRVSQQNYLRENEIDPNLLVIYIWQPCILNAARRASILTGAGVCLAVPVRRHQGRSKRIGRAETVSTRIYRVFPWGKIKGRRCSSSGSTRADAWTMTLRAAKRGRSVVIGWQTIIALVCLWNGAVEMDTIYLEKLF